MSADLAASTNTSKSAQKKKSKKEAQLAVESTAPTPETSIAAEGDSNLNGISHGGQETAYVKELQRNIRNVTKKLTATQKVDAIVAENPDSTLDELVNSKKINLDQKAQALKKPALQAQLVQLEEQYAVYKKLEQDFQLQLDKERERLEAAHQVEIASLSKSSEEDAKGAQATVFRSHLLSLSMFLRAAAARRPVEDETTEDSQAFEGILMDLYGGNTSAVDAAEKLIQGSDDTVKSTEGNTLTVTYARVKELAEAMAPPEIEGAPAQQDEDAATEVAPSYTQAANTAETDPTIAHAGLNELDSSHSPLETEVQPQAAQTSIDAGAANASAASQWDTGASSIADPMAESWVSVPRPADETENRPAPSASADTNNWENKNGTADASNNQAGEWGETVDAPNKVDWADETPEAQPNDGFREVHHHSHHRGGGGGRGRGGAGFDGRGGGRGRGRGGFRGDARGGRGRGPRGPPRGRPEVSA